MQQPQAPQGVKQQETKIEKRDIVLDDKENLVTITDTVTNIYKGTYRDLLTDYRNLENEKKSVEDQLTEDFLNKRREYVEKLNKDMAELKPFVDKAEAREKEIYEEQKLNGMVTKLKEELSKPESKINMSYLANVWDNLMENEPKVIKALTMEEHTKFTHLKQEHNRMMRKQNRGKKPS